MGDHRHPDRDLLARRRAAAHRPRTMAFPNPPAILAGRDLTAAELAQDTPDALLRLYAWMHLARATDNRILELFRQGLIRGTVAGGQGNEGLVVPLALLADKTVDVVSFSHRGLGGHLIWGGHLCDHLNQYFANAGSPTRAREGNIHHGDPARRSLPMISHLGTMLSLVAGATDSQRRLGRAAVGLAFFGDGAASTGEVHETLNLAALLALPVVFVIENNGYAYSTPVREQYPAGVALWRRAAGYGIEGFALDATADPAATARTLAAALATARATSRPVLIEAHTLRLRGHAAYDTCDYLLPGESEAFFAADPLPKFRARLAAAGHAAALEPIEANLNAFLEACVQVSLAVPGPDPAGMADDVFAPPAPPFPWVPSIPERASAGDALQVCRRKCSQWPRPSIAPTARSSPSAPSRWCSVRTSRPMAGAFKVTEGLLADFGRPRVCNMPLAESACTGWAIGLALNGHRPIEEFQFADFSTEAITQITLNAATMHFRSGAKGAARAAAALRRRADLWLVPLAGAGVGVPGHARAQGALSWHTAGRLQRPARRL